jgi:transcription initiation factor TFIIIB Brf1 subunit/transcription initiation factor TFIIB
MLQKLMILLQNQIKMREDVVLFLAKLCKDLKLPTILLYTAINYFDRMSLDQTNLSRHYVAISIATACLLVASKVEEDQIQTPLSIAHILEIAQIPVRRRRIIECEAFVLCRLDWRLRVVTLLHHANRLHSIGMYTEHDAISGASLADCPSAVQRVTDFVRYFCDLLLLDQCKVSARFNTSAHALQCSLSFPSFPRCKHAQSG